MAANIGNGKPICRGCTLVIDQGSIVQFGNGMWHLACFNCVKCHKNIEPDSNLLLLSDGSPLCSECSQHCNVCNLPISDEAVMTADQCYHAKCFKCTKCNNKIEGSLFARTSSGIYCMSCYAERREAQKKKGQGSNAPKSNSTKEKSLPSLPVEALFELGSEEKDRPNSAGLDTANFKANSTPAISHSHSLSSKSSSTRTNLGAILEQQTGNDINRKPSMVRKNTNEKIPPIDQTYSQAYVDGLRAEIKNLQRQLADSEFNHSKLKLHNDQVTERIKVFQEEFSNEISRRKAAETQLARVENENKANHITILDLTRRISEMDADIAQMHEQRKLENGFDSPVSDGRDTPLTYTIPEESELRVGSALRASISSDTSLKGRFTSVRRSLDMRTNEEGFLTLPSGKRISMDDLSIPESVSVPPSPPISSERDGKSGKRFWKMPFKTSPRPGETLKAHISSPKFPPENLKAQISSPKGPSESFARAMDSKGPIPAMFASLDAPLGDSHTLLPHPYLRPVRCDTCKEKMWGLQTRELRCSACGFHCHVKCASSAPYDCPGPGREYPRLADSLISGRSASPPVEVPGLFGVELSQQLVTEGDNLIPRIVEQCVKAVEARGNFLCCIANPPAMTMEGIYRKSGPQTVMKSLRQQLVEGPVDLDMAEFSDITAVTSVLKQYFRELPIPLFTYEYYDAWLQASVTPEAERVEAYAMVLAALPPAYRRTLIFFLDHLYRIFLEQKSNLMSSKNIGVVFGPTLLRCQDDLRDFDDMAKKNAAVDSLIQVWDQVKEKEQADSLKSNSQ